MTRNVPEHWVERLFARMQSIYGARFQDFWRNVDDLDEVKAVWREGLASVADEDLRRGVAALFHTRNVPDLPAFLELCRPTPQQFAPHECLSDQRQRLTPNGEAQLDRIKAMVKATSQSNNTRTGHIRWAVRLLERATNGEHITAFQVAFAEEAIKRWEATHGPIDASDGEPIREPIELPRVVPSPHIYDPAAGREPGSDDDLEGAAA
ncbi:hypothetical protein B0G84_3298 [Paraburkholderia sp. BL8N3]|nr:hypothetical protein [Paraburkholderia sp. BL8N3]TCK37996.1 hypothetical protein B0G84_3298 [Paraburkholderia sp. BL8N3]